jgi:uncharacterized membrane protein (DUF373 family)
MNDNTIQLIRDYVDQISASLGVAAEKVFEALMRQQMIEGVMGIIVKLVLFISAIVAFKLYYRYVFTMYLKNKEAGKYDYLDEGPIFICVGLALSIVFIFVTFLILILNLTTHLTQILNPQYHVLKDLLYMVTGKQ